MVSSGELVLGKGREVRLVGAVLLVTLASVNCVLVAKGSNWGVRYKVGWSSRDLICTF